MFNGPAEFDSGTAIVAPPTAGQAVPSPELTTASLLARVSAVHASLATVVGAPDIETRRNSLQVRAQEIGQVLATLGTNYLPEDLLGPNRELQQVEHATTALLAQAGGGVAVTRAANDSLYYETKPVRSYRLWWVFGGLAVAATTAFWVAYAVRKGKGRRGLGSLHASKAGGGGVLKDAIPAA